MAEPHPQYKALFHIPRRAWQGSGPADPNPSQLLDLLMKRLAEAGIPGVTFKRNGLGGRVSSRDPQMLLAVCGEENANAAKEILRGWKEEYADRLFDAADSSAEASAEEYEVLQERDEKATLD